MCKNQTLQGSITQIYHVSEHVLLFSSDAQLKLHVNTPQLDAQKGSRSGLARPAQPPTHLETEVVVAEVSVKYDGRIQALQRENESCTLQHNRNITEKSLSRKVLCVNKYA